MSILVHGRGVSAMTAAWILAEQGYHITIVGPSYNQDLQVAINQDTLSLLNEIFQVQLQEVPTAHWIRGRLVGWNGESDAVSEGSLSIRTGALTHELESQLTKRFNGSVSWTDEKIDLEEATFTFEASTKLQDRQVSSLSFGKRVATIASARMSDSSNFSRVEQTKLGWQFLLPTSENEGKLFVIVANPDLCPKSCVETAVQDSSFCSIVQSVEDIQPWVLVAPKLSQPLVAANRIRIGEGAFSFDPVCGDGIGYAVRSSLLATTTFFDLIRGEFRGLEYYRARILKTFQAHLHGCANVYSGWSADGWAGEIAVTLKGLEFLKPIRTRN
jgi:hypothetical protein